jgi:hypothetical protein
MREGKVATMEEDQKMTAPLRGDSIIRDADQTKRGKKKWPAQI